MEIYRFFCIVEGGFTLQVDRQEELEKRQILGNEWAVPRSRGFVSKAGHPHWQLEAVESFRTFTVKPEARFGDLTDSYVVQEFNSETEPNVVGNPLLSLAVKDMRLMSVAYWWRSPEVYVPRVSEIVNELGRWIMSCVYTRQEASRFTI